MKRIQKLTSLSGAIFLSISSLVSITIPAANAMADTVAVTSVTNTSNSSNTLSSSTASIPAATSQTVSATSNLSIGMSGSAIVTLQQNLQTLGYFTYPSITGYFGTVTQSAVIQFQTAYGLKPDGIVGPLTNTAIGHALTKKQIVSDSMNYIGIPYQWGGSTPQTGFDCSGFIYYLFQQHGVTTVPRTTSTLISQLGTSVSRDQLEPGDLVFFSTTGDGTITHVGLYLGNGNFISPLSSKGVYVQALSNSYWAPKFIKAQRVY